MRHPLILLLVIATSAVAGALWIGLTNKEIGRALTLSPRTVETHRAHLFDKLEAATLAQVIRQYAALAEAGAP